MSPGAFWGHPGGANPFINPAVGAPVHPSRFFGMHPVSPQHGMEEVSDYFPQVPPPGASEEYSEPSPTDLAKEILKDKDEMRNCENDDSSSSAITDALAREGERWPASLTDTSRHMTDGEDYFNLGHTVENGVLAISRTHSASPPKPPTLERSGSDPAHTHSIKDAVSSRSGASSSR
jgi:hypothetical protein